MAKKPKAEKLAAVVAERVPEKEPETGRFIPGNNGGPGRPKGARNKLGEEFIQRLYEDFQANGPVVIEAVRLSKPDAYLKVIASILPKELNIKVSELEEMTDEQLNRRIRELAEQVLGLGIGEATGGKEKAH